MQRELRRAGYNTGRIDGDWGPRTHNAFKRFWRSTRPATENPPLELDDENGRVSIETSLWNRLMSTPDGAGGEDMGSSSSGSGSGSGSRAGSGSSSGSRSGSGNTSTSDTSEDESKWWQSPWLWGGVALAAGAGVVLVATRKDDDESEELDDEEFEDGEFEDGELEEFDFEGQS